VIVNSLDDALTFRKQLSIYDKSIVQMRNRRSFPSTFLQFKTTPGYFLPRFGKLPFLREASPVIGIVAVFGVSFLAAAAGWSMFNTRNKKHN
jgi:hypothetical protein